MQLGIGLGITEQRRRRAFSPLSLSPAAWYDAEQGVYTDAAAQFTAANSEYLSRTSNSTLQTGDVDFWLSGWAYFDSVTGGAGLIGKWAAGAYEYIVYRSGTSLLFYVSQDGSTTPLVTASVTLATGQWYFFLAYHDAVSNTINISVNGAAFVSAAHSAGVQASATALQLGRDGGTAYLGGRLDSVAFGKSPSGGIAALATTIRDTLYNSGSGKVYADLTSAQKTDWGLVSWWDLDEASGTRFDAHGTNHLTDNNTVTQAAGIAAGTASAAPVQGKAAQFTAANSEYLSIIDNEQVSVGDASAWWAGWVKFTSIVGNQGILSKWAGPGGHEFIFWSNGGALKFEASPDGTTITTLTGPSLAGGGIWQFVMIYHDAANDLLGVSLDGGAFTTQAHSGGIANGTNPLRFGHNVGGISHFDGAMDSWCFGKSPTDSFTAIRDRLYNSGQGLVYDDLTDAEKTDWGLVSWWDLEEASGTREDEHGTNDLTDNNTVTQADGIAQHTGDWVPVSRWEDQSGNARHLTQSTLSKRPLWRAGQQNGRPVVRFDGVNDCLQASNVPLSTFTFSGVVKLSGTAGMIAEHSADANGNDGHYLYGTTGMTMKVRRSAVISDKDYAINWAVDNAAKLVTHSYGGTHLTNLLRINRAAVSTASAGGSTGDPGTGTVTTTLNIGSRNNGASLPSTGNFCELVFVTPEVNTTQRDNLENYLQGRWGTP